MCSCNIKQQLSILSGGMNHKHDKHYGGMNHKKHDGAGNCNSHEKNGGGMRHNEKYYGGENKKPLVIKLFWVEWCGHCRKFKPVWEKLKQENTEDVNYEDINCEEEKEIAHNEGIQGFPTIRLYDADNNLLEELEGGRDEDNIKNLIQNHM